MTKPRAQPSRANKPGRPIAGTRTDTVLLRASGHDGALRIGLYDITTDPDVPDGDDLAIRAALDLLPRDAFGHYLFTHDILMPPRDGGLSTWPCRLASLPRLQDLRGALNALGHECLTPRLDGVSQILAVLQGTPEDWHRISLGDPDALLTLLTLAMTDRVFASLLYCDQPFREIEPLSQEEIYAAIPGYTAFCATYPRPDDKAWSTESAVAAVKPEEFARFMEHAATIRLRMPAAEVRLRLESGLINEMVVTTRLFIRVTTEAEGERLSVRLALD